VEYLHTYCRHLSFSMEVRWMSLPHQSLGPDVGVDSVEFRLSSTKVPTYSLYIIETQEHIQYINVHAGNDHASSKQLRPRANCQVNSIIDTASHARSTTTTWLRCPRRSSHGSTASSTYAKPYDMTRSRAHKCAGIPGPAAYLL